MNGKIAFVLGAGLGYVLGTRSGRQQYERIKGAGKSVWEHPKVQEKVSQAEEKIGDVVREQGSQVADKVAGVVKDKLGGGSGSRDDGAGPVAGGGYGSTPGADGPPER